MSARYIRLGALYIPMYEGMVLPNDWTGEWGGFDACERCFGLQSKLVAPVEACDLAQT